ncbi:MAG: HdeD family acid-resistance protein [Chloroflexi bacterium]|nr:HdeD family acid-resistance protein [Chloroflexota bacterium]
MYQALVRNTRLLALSGVAAVAFGVLTLVWPGLTFVALLALFGAFAFVMGSFTLAGGLNLLAERQTTWVPYVLGGLAGIAVGAATFLWPGWTALTLVYLIAFWAIVTGIFEFVAAIELAGQLDGGWMLGLSGALSAAFGVLVALYPRSGALAIVWIIGLYAILGGVTRLYLAYRVNHMGKAARSTLQHLTGQS